MIKTWKQSNDPDFEAKKNRVLELYDIADGKAEAGEGDPSVIMCVDEFGPLNLLPRPGKHWAPTATKATRGIGDGPRRRRRRATYNRNDGVRHLLAAYDLGKDKIYGHIKTTKNRTKFLEFCRYLRSLYPPEIRIAIVMDNFSPHLSTKKYQRVGKWAAANNVELAYVPPTPAGSTGYGPVPGAALLRPRRHRPPVTGRAELDDPPLHRLAKPKCERRGTS